jgi:hypothetical protein
MPTRNKLPPLSRNKYGSLLDEKSNGSKVASSKSPTRVQKRLRACVCCRGAFGTVAGVASWMRTARSSISASLMSSSMSILDLTKGFARVRIAITTKLRTVLRGSAVTSFSSSQIRQSGCERSSCAFDPLLRVVVVRRKGFDGVRNRSSRCLLHVKFESWVRKPTGSLKMVVLNDAGVNHSMRSTYRKGFIVGLSILSGLRFRRVRV